MRGSNHAAVSALAVSPSPTALESAYWAIYEPGLRSAIGAAAQAGCRLVGDRVRGPPGAMTGKMRAILTRGCGRAIGPLSGALRG